MPFPQKVFENFMQKIMHFGAKFLLVLRCIQSIEGDRRPIPLESATAFHNLFCSDLQFPNILTLSPVGYDKTDS